MKHSFPLRALKTLTRLFPAGLLAVTFFAAPIPAVAQNGTSVKPGGDAWYADPMDWPNWRGPELDGVSREKGLVDRWNPQG